MVRVMVFVTSKAMRNVACSVMAVAKLGAAVYGDYPAGGVVVKRVDDNVMNGVLGMLQLLQLDQLSSSQHENLTTAVSAAEHLLEILDDVLVFSKAEAGKIVLESIAFDAAQLVEDCARLMARDQKDHDGECRGR